MNGLTSNYYNLINESNINTNNIVVSGKFNDIPISYFNNLRSNIQQQLDNNNFSISGNIISTITNDISGGFKDIYNTINNNYVDNSRIITTLISSVSGSIFNVNNSINHNETFINTINNFFTNSLIGISGQIFKINNDLNNVSINNSEIITSISGII
jgi:hypothetical protein